MASKPGEKPDLVEVEWLDATSLYEQLTFEAARKGCRLDRRLSLGYVVERSRERIVICHTYDPAPEGESRPDEGADFTTIPRGWVRRITSLVASTEAEPKEDTE